MSAEPWSLTELTSRFLDQQRQARTVGIVEVPAYEVEPHDTVPSLAVDARSAWRDAVAALDWFSDAPAATMISPPPGWVSLVSVRFPIVALPFACGHFPQIVRDLPALLRRESNRLTEVGPIDFSQRSSLTAWIESVITAGRFPESLLGLGLSRVAGDFDLAERFVTLVNPRVPEQCRVAWENELAALAWTRGEQRRAEETWKSLPDRPPVIFNRGLAALFGGRGDEASRHFTSLRSVLPEDTSWYQLAELYTALARL